jgi:hypothetical protein
VIYAIPQKPSKSKLSSIDISSSTAIKTRTTEHTDPVGYPSVILRPIPSRFSISLALFPPPHPPLAPLPPPLRPTPPKILPKPLQPLPTAPLPTPLPDPNTLVLLPPNLPYLLRAKHPPAKAAVHRSHSLLRPALVRAQFFPLPGFVAGGDVRGHARAVLGFESEVVCSEIGESGLEACVVLEGGGEGLLDVV